RAPSRRSCRTVAFDRRDQLARATRTLVRGSSALERGPQALVRGPHTRAWLRFEREPCAERPRTERFLLPATLCDNPRMQSLGPSIVVLGDIEAHDDLVIEGRVKGHVRSERAAVTVSEGAMITGDIVARVIVVAGQVTGTLTASERVEIDETANVKARIIAS